MRESGRSGALWHCTAEEIVLTQHLWLDRCLCTLCLAKEVQPLKFPATRKGSTGVILVHLRKTERVPRWGMPGEGVHILVRVRPLVFQLTKILICSMFDARPLRKKTKPWALYFRQVFLLTRSMAPIFYILDSCNRGSISGSTLRA